MKKTTIIIPVFLLVLGVLIYTQFPKTKILTGYASKMICTCHFQQNRSIDDILNEELNFSFFKYVNVHVNPADSSITCDVLGLSPKTSKYNQGRGCTLLQGKDDYNIKYSPPTILDTFQWNYAQSLSSKFEYILDTILFDQGDRKIKNTRSCIILKNDTIIYNKHSGGFDESTPQLGWSMTKSVMSTLAGILAKEGSLNLQDDHLFQSWSDDHNKITLADLLHMKSGLSWTEDYTTQSPATEMLFNQEDMVNYAKGRNFEAPIGTHFEYSSGSSNLIAGILRSKFSSDSAYYNLAYKKLFAPLGLSTAFIETDESGNFVGSSYMWASALDWVKYGLLYLHKGNWQGQQIIDTSWVNYTFESDSQSKGEYGTQFWHNDGLSLPDAPQDMIFADGFQGQRIFILPSQNIIIVRMGYANINFNQLIKTVLTSS